MILKPVVHFLGNTYCVKVSQWLLLKRLQQYTLSKINVSMSNFVKSFFKDYTRRYFGGSMVVAIYLSPWKEELYIRIKENIKILKLKYFYSFYTKWQFMAEFTISKISGRIWWMIWWPSSLLSIISYYNAGKLI